jgi:hypothetical protein
MEATVAKPFLQGQLVGATTTFRNAAGSTFDPYRVVFEFEDPTGAKTTHESPARLSQGVYEEQVALTLSGTWWYRVEGRNEAGKAVAVDEGPIEVEPTHF